MTEVICKKTFPLPVSVESAKEQELCEGCDPATKFMCHLAIDAAGSQKENENE